MTLVRLFLLLSALILSSAGSAIALSEEASKLLSADPEEVKGCKFLGDIYHMSAWSLSSAQEVVLDNAVKVGATHIVWIEQRKEYGNFITGGVYHARLRAYKCSPEQEKKPEPVAKEGNGKIVKITYKLTILNNNGKETTVEVDDAKNLRIGDVVEVRDGKAERQ